MKFIKISTSDDVILHGVGCFPKKSDTVIVHIHGKCGNFYANNFIEHMMNGYRTKNIAFASINTRGHDCISENISSKHVEYIGGSLEKPGESRIDLRAIVEHFASQFTKIILQGHSSGCDKIVDFLVHESVDEINSLIFLSPTDNKRLHESYLKRNKNYPLEIKRTNKKLLFDLAYMIDYGVLGNSDTFYPIPVSKDALRSIVEGDDYNVFDYTDGPTWNLLNLSAIIFFGKNDPLQIHSQKKVSSFFISAFKDTDIHWIDGANHQFLGKEDILTAKILGQL